MAVQRALVKTTETDDALLSLIDDDSFERGSRIVVGFSGGLLPNPDR